MKRIECVLLMILMMSLGVAAQAPKKATGRVSSPQAAENTQPASQSGADQTAASEAQPETTVAAAVSTSVSASFSPLPDDASIPSVTTANVELQSQIQEALSKDPTLSKCSVVVTASADGIDLTGNAGNSRERLAAWRLAESYARGKKVDNHILVNGQGGPGPASSHRETGAPASNTAPSSGTSPGLQNNRQ